MEGEESYADFWLACQSSSNRREVRRLSLPEQNRRPSGFNATARRNSVLVAFRHDPNDDMKTDKIGANKRYLAPPISQVDEEESLATLWSARQSSTYRNRGRRLSLPEQKRRPNDIVGTTRRNSVLVELMEILDPQFLML